jgi:prevent-host-death family protein
LEIVVMIEVGAYEAKTQFSSLLDRVEQGEEVRITRHGRPIARMVPEREIDRAAIDKAIAELKEIRKGARLDGLSWKELRDAGRR